MELNVYISHRASLVTQMVESACNAGDPSPVSPWAQKFPWRMEWQSTQVFLPMKNNIYNAINLLYSRSYHKSVNQLYFNKKFHLMRKVRTPAEPRADTHWRESREQQPSPRALCQPQPTSSAPPGSCKFTAAWA